MSIWQLQKAKAHLSDLVKSALLEPQSITVHGKPTVVLMSQEQYEKLTKANCSLVAFLRKSPLKDVKLNIKRDKSLTRDEKL